MPVTVVGNNIIVFINWLNCNPNIAEGHEEFCFTNKISIFQQYLPCFVKNASNSNHTCHEYQLEFTYNKLLMLFNSQKKKNPVYKILIKSLTTHNSKFVVHKYLWVQ